MLVLRELNVPQLGHRETAKLAPGFHHGRLKEVWKGQNTMSVLHSETRSQNGRHNSLQLSVFDRPPDFR